MRRVKLQGIRNFVCRGTDLEINPGELLVLLGPNGAGKTTLLNVIAGLVAYDGTVTFDGVAVDDVPARERQVGYVFQDLVLFPHLDVTANIAFGLSSLGRPEDKRDTRVSELLELLAISRLSRRYPGTLSGGEQQRVALARALAPRPRILLLDEPFSSLDEGASRLMRTELKQLQRDLGTTTVFVTHDLAEAEEVADRVAVVQDGIVKALGAPDEVLFGQRTGTTSDSLGTLNVFECASTRPLGHGLVAVDCSGLLVVVPHQGEGVRQIRILPRDVAVSAVRPARGVNVFAGTVRQAEEQGGMVAVQVEVGRHRVAAELPMSPLERRSLQVGSEVFVELPLTRLRAKGAEGGVPTGTG